MQRQPGETSISGNPIQGKERIEEFRVTKDQRVIRDLTAKLSTFSEAKQFLATEAVLITYEDMTGKDVEGNAN